MRLPSAPSLFRAYALALAVLVISAVGAGLLASAHRASQSDRGGIRQLGELQGATVVSFSGPAPSARAIGEPFYYGPLTAGDCLPPIDIVAFEPHFDFHGFGTVLNFGTEHLTTFKTIASSTEGFSARPAAATHVQVCFSGGIDHEQVVIISPKVGAARAAPIFGEGRIPPPPLRRNPSSITARLGRLSPGALRIHGRSVFSSIGLELEFAHADARAVVVEFGDFDDKWRFQAVTTRAVGAGERATMGRVSAAPFFRIVLPEGAVGAEFHLVPAGADD